MSEPVLLCRDCRHSFRQWTDFLTLYAPLRCRQRFISEKVEVDPVSGPSKQRAHYRSCSSERMFSGPDEVCGREGRLWQPRNARGFITYLRRI